MFILINRFFSDNLRILNLRDSAGIVYGIMNNSLICLYCFFNKNPEQPYRCFPV